MSGIIKARGSLWPKYMQEQHDDGTAPGIIGPAQLDTLFQGLAMQYPHAVTLN